MRYPSFKTALRRFQKNISCLSAEEQWILRRAYRTATKAHCEQKKFGLYPYIIHPLSVFNFLFEKVRVRDCDILVAALLHDVIEDSDITLDALRIQFGARACNIIKTVTRIPKAGETEAEKKILKMRHFQEFVYGGSWGAKVLGIADKYDNMRHAPLIPLSSPHREKFPRWINETKAFIALAESIDAIACRELKKILAKLERVDNEKYE